MKYHMQSILIVIFLLITATESCAYVYSFFNHTAAPIAIAIQFRNKNEPLYPGLIHPHTMTTFGDGEEGIPTIKDSYCLTYLRYVKAPTTSQKKHNFATAPWKETNIIWAPLEIYHAIVDIITPRHIPTAKNKAIIAPIDYQSLSNLITGIKTKPQTLCTDRHIDIVEDAHGKIFFISPLIKI